MTCALCNHTNCEGCCAKCSDPTCPDNAGCPDCSGRTARPLGVEEAERIRANGQATGHPSGEGTAYTAPPSVRLVRVPDEIADCSFPRYAEAAWPEMTDPYTGESVGLALPVSDIPISDRYQDTAPIPLGGPMPAVTLLADAQGIIGAVTAPPDGGDDIRRAALKRIYRKRARDLLKWGTVAGVSTEENARKAIDPTE